MVNIIGHIGGRVPSLKQGTEVELAGRKAFLPNDNAPVLVQELTLRQIAAIPKDRFAVSLIETVKPLTMAAPGHKGRGWSSARNIQRMRRLVRQAERSSKTGLVSKLSRIKMAGDDGTKQYTTIITLLDKMKQTTDSLYDTALVLSRNQRDTPPENDSDLFYPPIDDGNMSDCIKKAMAHFFGDKDICKIYGKEYKPAAFCLLMHDYFIRMHILKNTSRTPFCEFLQERVLKGEMLFTSRTFTNYANEYKNIEQDFTEPDRVKINFNIHPEPSGMLLDAFHEIGHYFHTSKYFNHLRKMRDNMKEFKI